MCSAGTVVIAASNNSNILPSRASSARAMRTPHEPFARAKPSATTRRVFVREVLFGSRLIMLRGVDVAKNKSCAPRRCRYCGTGIRSAVFKFRERGRFFGDLRSVAMVDADPIEVGA